MQFAFLKMHGAGNQILVVDERRQNRPPPEPDAVRKLGNLRTGPGFDQLMWVGPASDPSNNASYRVFNADGSEVEQCGNGVRCVAWMLGRTDDRRHFELEGPAGLVSARLRDNNRVAVSMGVPEFSPELVPFVAERAALTYELAFELDDELADEPDGDQQTLSVAVLSMGNPHCILEVDDVSNANVAGIGPVIERHDRFPAGTNVGFMAIRSKSDLDLRVHERGVGETAACGTGACAAAVAAQRLGRVADEVTVNLPGGQLVVKWRRDANPVWLTGETQLISEGMIDL